MKFKEGYVPVKGDYYLEDRAFHTFTGTEWDIEQPDGNGMYAFDTISARYPYVRIRDISSLLIKDINSSGRNLIDFWPEA